MHNQMTDLMRYAEAITVPFDTLLVKHHHRILRKWDAIGRHSLCSYLTACSNDSMPFGQLDNIADRPRRYAPGLPDYGRVFLSDCQTIRIRRQPRHVGIW